MADLDLDKMAAVLFCLVRHNSNYEIVVISVINITHKHLEACIPVSKSILTSEEMFAYMCKASVKRASITSHLRYTCKKDMLVSDLL